MALRRFTSWLKSNADAVTALIGGGLIGLIALLDIDVLGSDGDTVNGAVLLVLALLATSVLRDRRTAVRATRQARQLQVLHGREVGDELARARDETDHWWFRGGTGTYLRAVTLPECVERSQRAGLAFSFQIEIIDPTDPQVCEVYAKARRDVPHSEPWTADRARNEAYATILACAYYRQTAPFVKLDLALSERASALRWDLSSRCVVQTQEDPNDPALMLVNGHPLYTNTQRELRLSFDQARKVPLEDAEDVRLSEEPTHDEVRQLFERLQLGLPTSVTQAQVGDIIRRALHARNPYPV